MAKQVWEFKTTDRWIRSKRNGKTIIDSKNAKLMIESPGELDYYVPLADIQQAILLGSEQSETSGYRGQKNFWHLQIGDELLENAAWNYAPKDGRPDFSGYVAIDWYVMDQWFEEDEEVFYHPRSPYHRVDTIQSSRHVQVLVDGVKVADTKRPYLLFETNIPTRYYIPGADVAMEYLSASDTQSNCPYKGFASYYNLKVNDETIKDAVWTYPDPIPEAPKLKGQLSFWVEKDKRIEIIVDGQSI